MRHVHVMLNKSFSLIDNALYLLGCFQLQIIEDAIQNGFEIARIYYYLIYLISTRVEGHSRAG